VKTCARCHNSMGPPYDMNTVCPPCFVEANILNVTDREGSVLDVGSGLGRYIPALHNHVDGNIVLLDAHPHYMNAMVKQPEKVVHIVGDLRLVLPMIGDNSFDTVLAIDVIEHLTKEDAFIAIRHMQRIAERRVAVFTPDGFMPQDKDHYGMGGDHWQTHRSGWTIEDLKEIGFHTVLAQPNLHGPGQGALFAWT
jgi:ubiquinone/menaquinone biosynthesis C-methylase UbiE